MSDSDAHNGSDLQELLLKIEERTGGMHPGRAAATPDFGGEEVRAYGYTGMWFVPSPGLRLSLGSGVDLDSLWNVRPAGSHMASAYDMNVLYRGVLPRLATCRLCDVKTMRRSPVGAPAACDVVEADYEIVEDERAASPVVQYVASAQAGTLFVQQVLEGVVLESVPGGEVRVEFRTAAGPLVQTFLAEQFETGARPESGAPVRIVAHLLSAPDREAVAEDFAPLIDDFDRAKPQGGADGEYRLGER